MSFSDDRDTICCEGWAEPHRPLASLPRIRQDRDGLRFAARDILDEGQEFARFVLANPATDQRIARLLRQGASQ